MTYRHMLYTYRMFVCFCLELPSTAYGKTPTSRATLMLLLGRPRSDVSLGEATRKHFERGS